MGLAPHVGASSWSLAFTTLTEFVFAQTTHSIQPLMVGLMVLSVGLSSATGIGLYKLICVIFPNTDSWFSTNIALGVASAVCLFLFVYISKRCKLRKKNGNAPISRLHVKKYFKKQREGQRRLDSEELDQLLRNAHNNIA